MGNFGFKANISRFVPGTTRYVGENAFVLIDCARLAYQSSRVITNKLTEDWNFDRVEFFSGRSTQAFVGGNSDFIIVSFRGTEPPNLNDWFRNLDVDFADSLIGEVHGGFQKALLEVWGGENGILKHILDFRDNQQSVWFCGHSLGGALAMLAAVYLQIKEGIIANGLYTIGQPRVGNNRFATAFNQTFGNRGFRFVNNNDVVTRVPAWWRGYRHGLNRLYFDSHGNLLDAISSWREIFDATRGVIDSIGDLGLDAINDHDYDAYVRLIEINRSVSTPWA